MYNTPVIINIKLLTIVFDNNTIIKLNNSGDEVNKIIDINSANPLPSHKFSHDIFVK